LSLTSEEVHVVTDMLSVTRSSPEADQKLPGRKQTKPSLRALSLQAILLFEGRERVLVKGYQGGVEGA